MKEDVIEENNTLLPAILYPVSRRKHGTLVLDITHHIYEPIFQIISPLSSPANFQQDYRDFRRSFKNVTTLYLVVVAENYSMLSRPPQRQDISQGSVMTRFMCGVAKLVQVCQSCAQD